MQNEDSIKMSCSREMRELLTKTMIAHSARERHLHNISLIGGYKNCTYTHDLPTLLEYMGVCPNTNISHAIFTHFAEHMNDVITYFDLAWGDVQVGSPRHHALYDLINNCADDLSNFVRVNLPVLINEGSSREQTVYPMFSIDFTHFYAVLEKSNEPESKSITNSDVNPFKLKQTTSEFSK